MACSNPTKSVKIDERSVQEQEHRKMSRFWDRVVRKNSLSAIDPQEYGEESKKGVRFRGSCPRPVYDSEIDDREVSESSTSTLQCRMAKKKTFAKRKSPLQKFDEIVTTELTNRRFAEDEEICPLDKPQKWPPNFVFSCSKISSSSRKASFDTQLSKTTLCKVEKELKNKDMDPSDIENADLMEAIEKLVQAQASCRFDAAVKAADAAASSVPIEFAEEAAITCARDYQSHIVDLVNEKVGGGDGKKPMEVIGYIGITKRKDTGDDE